MGRTLLSSGAFVILLGGCGEDPVLEAAHEQVREQAASEGPPPGGEPGHPQEPGRPEDPAPGVPDEPPPGGGEVGDIVPQGETVGLSGEVQVPGYSGGAVVVDVFDGDHSQTGGARPSVVGRSTLEAPGPFALRLPKGAPAWISAYVDVDGNGRPDNAEPVGSAPGNPYAGVEDQAGVRLVLETPDAE